MSKKIIFSSMVEKYMRKRNLTMKELGEKVNKSESAVSYWISGKALPRMGTIQELADIFGITTDEMLYGKFETAESRDEFISIDEAMLFLISNPTVSAYGGYDFDRMSDEEKIQFANKVAGMFKVISEEYKNK